MWAICWVLEIQNRNHIELRLCWHCCFCLIGNVNYVSELTLHYYSLLLAKYYLFPQKILPENVILTDREDMLQRENIDTAEVNLLLKAGMHNCLKVSFYFFSCSFTHISHNSSYRWGIPKVSENKKRKRQPTAETIFLSPCISTFHSDIVKLWFRSGG